MKNQDQNKIVLLAGWSCTGKSTISNLVSKQLGFILMDQNEIYHDLSCSKGYERAREWLADVGREVFIRETVAETIRRMGIQGENTGFVIDATYGELMVEMLRDAFPGSKLFVIYVFSDPEIREGRMMGRLGGVEREIAKQELGFRDGFLSESGLERVISEADYVVDNSCDIEESVRQMTDIIER